MMFSRFMAISLVVATAYSSAFGSCLKYDILALNAKKGGNKSLNKTALIGTGSSIAGTYITSSVAVAKSAQIGAASIAVGASAILATGVIAGVATIGVTTYLIKRSKNTNTDLLALSHQIVNGQVSLNDFNESNDLISNSHVKLSRHLKRFISLKNELNQNLGLDLANKDLAELIIYLDLNTHVKNSEKIHSLEQKSMAGVNPFCSFSKTKLVLKGFKLKYQLNRKTYKHDNMVKLLTAAIEARAVNASGIKTTSAITKATSATAEKDADTEDDVEYVEFEEDDKE